MGVLTRGLRIKGTLVLIVSDEALDEGSRIRNRTPDPVRKLGIISFLGRTKGKKRRVGKAGTGAATTHQLYDFQHPNVGYFLHGVFNLLL